MKEREKNEPFVDVLKMENNAIVVYISHPPSASPRSSNEN